MLLLRVLTAVWSNQFYLFILILYILNSLTYIPTRDFFYDMTLNIFFSHFAVVIVALQIYNVSDGLSFNLKLFIVYTYIYFIAFLCTFIDCECYQSGFLKLYSKHFVNHFNGKSTNLTE